MNNEEHRLEPEPKVAPPDESSVPPDISPCLSVVDGIPPPPETDEQTFARLGALSPAQYDRLRHAEAKRLQIRLETLDAEVAHARTELGYLLGLRSRTARPDQCRTQTRRLRLPLPRRRQRGPCLQRLR